MNPEPPSGQGPVDPQKAFSPPPPPGGAGQGPAGPGFGPPPLGGGGMPPSGPGGMPPFGPPPGMYPPMYPPAMGGMPYRPPPRRSGWRTMLGFLAVLALVASICINFVLLLGGGGLFGGSGAYEVVREGTSDQKIAVIPIDGVIDEAMAKQVSEWCRKIEHDNSIKAVVLQVDTPGGGVTASDQIHHKLEELRATRNIPIAVSMGGLATSGGYYISCMADQIYAQPTTFTGNIGVLMPRYNLSELVNKIGVRESTITAPPNGYKNAGSMFQPEKPEDKAYFQELINSAYARFKQLVTDGRKGRKKFDPKADIFNGQIFTAKQAEDHGLVDGIGYIDDAYDWAKKKAGLNKPLIIRYQRRVSLLDLLGSRSSVGNRSASSGVQINMRVDPKVLEELQSPRPMYMWQGQ